MREEVRRPRFQTVVVRVFGLTWQVARGWRVFLCGFFMVNPLLPLHTGAKVGVSRRNRA